jgi:hypothetical protein
MVGVVAHPTVWKAYVEGLQSEARSGFTGLYSSSIFSFSRDFHITFQSSCTNLHSYQQCRSVFFFPLHPCKPLLWFVLLMIANFTGVRWNLSVILMCISFMAKYIEHFFICLFAFCTPSLKIVCLAHLPIYSVGCWLFERETFSVPCTFRLSISCQMYNWQRFSPIL